MEKFELNLSEYRIGKRLQKELSLLLFLVVIIFFFVGINVVYLTAVLIMYVLLLLLKRNRILYQIEFDDEASKIRISYFYLILFRGVETVSYEKIRFKSGFKRYGFGSAVETLELFKGKILLGEIRKEGKWKWAGETVTQIKKRLLNTVQSQ